MCLRSVGKMRRVPPPLFFGEVCAKMFNDFSRNATKGISHPDFPPCYPHANTFYLEAANRGLNVFPFLTRAGCSAGGRKDADIGAIGVGNIAHSA